MRYAVTVRATPAERDVIHEGFVGIDKIDIPKDTPRNTATRQLLVAGLPILTEENCRDGLAVLRELRVRFHDELDKLIRTEAGVPDARPGSVSLAKPGVVLELATEIKDRRLRAIDRAIRLLESAKENLAVLNPILHRLDFLQPSLDPEAY